MILLQAAADTAEKSSGTSDLQIALVGLSGVLVGTVISVLGSTIESIRAERRSHRIEMREHYSRFIAAIHARQILDRRIKRVKHEISQVEEEIGSLREALRQGETDRSTDPEGYAAGMEMRRSTANRVVHESDRMIRLSEQLIALLSDRQEMLHTISESSNYFLILGFKDLWVIARALGAEKYPSQKNMLESTLSIAVSREVAPRWTDRRAARRRLIRKVDPEFWHAYIDPASAAPEIGNERPATRAEDSDSSERRDSDGPSTGARS